MDRESSGKKKGGVTSQMRNNQEGQNGDELDSKHMEECRLGMQRQEDLCEFKGSLVYRTSSRTGSKNLKNIYGLSYKTWLETRLS